MTSTYMIYYTMVIFLCQPTKTLEPLRHVVLRLLPLLIHTILLDILHMRLRMVDSSLLTPCQSYNDTIS